MVEQFLAFLGYQVISLDFSIQIHFSEPHIPKVKVEILYFHNILNSSFRIVGALNSKNRPFFNFSVLAIVLSDLDLEPVP